MAVSAAVMSASTLLMSLPSTSIARVCVCVCVHAFNKHTNTAHVRSHSIRSITHSALCVEPQLPRGQQERADVDGPRNVAVPVFVQRHVKFVRTRTRAMANCAVDCIDAAVASGASVMRAVLLAANRAPRMNCSTQRQREHARVQHTAHQHDDAPQAQHHAAACTLRPAHLDRHHACMHARIDERRRARVAVRRAVRMNEGRKA